MSDRSEQKQILLDTLLLDGGNAVYLEQMQARYAANPVSVDPSWQAYFASLGDEVHHAQKTAQGPAWKRPDWPVDDTSDLTGALTGDWGDSPELAQKAVSKANPALSADAVKTAARDSLNALMLIRAYRVRGHLIADLDPLGLKQKGPD